MKTVPKKEKTVYGLVINQIHHRYQSMMYPGILDATKCRDSSLVCFIAKPLGTKSIQEKRENEIYHLASEKSLDGLIVVNNAIGKDVSQDDQRAFLMGYSPLPVVSISGYPVDGYTTIGLENKKGMQDLVLHLINDHGYKCLAFIKGPEKSFDAHTRYKVFLETLAENGIETQSLHVYEGDFVRSTGSEAVRVLLDERKIRPEVILCANDEMAIGVHRELLSRGLRIPEDIAITGFDNIDEAKIVNPSITTVNHPLYKEGWSGISLLSDILEGKSVPPFTTFPSKLVIRRSCGCRVDAESVNHRVIPAMPNFYAEKARQSFNYNELTDKLIETLYRDEIIIAEYCEVFEMDRKIITEVVQCFLNGLAADDISIFCSLQNCPSFSNIFPRLGYDFLRVITDRIVYHACSTLKLEDSICHAIDKFSNSVTLHLLDNLAHYHENRVIQARDFSWSMHNVVKALCSTSELSKLREILLQLLPSLELPFVFIGLYSKSQHECNIREKNTTVYLDYRESGIPGNPVGDVFPALEIVPDKPWKTDNTMTYLVYALATETESLGYVVFGHREAQDKNIYEALQGHFSSSLSSSMMLETILLQSNEMKSLLRDQEQKANLLEDAYSKLKENKDKIIIAEKMASLGRMTAGFSHEMSTPLATIRSCLMQLEILKTEYLHSIYDGFVSLADHKGIAEDLDRNISLARKASEKLSSFIKDIKSQTRTLSPEDRYEFDALPVLKETIAMLSHRFRQINCAPTLHVPQKPLMLLGYPARFSQVVSNLLINALDACSLNSDSTVRVSICREGRDAVLEVHDNGTGIPDDIQSRIFDPFFTTKPINDGMGLGLSIVHDIITGEFGGTINVESELGKGSTFIAVFPIAKGDS